MYSYELWLYFLVLINDVSCCWQSLELAFCTVAAQCVKIYLLKSLLAVCETNRKIETIILHNLRLNRGSHSNYALIVFTDECFKSLMIRWPHRVLFLVGMLVVYSYIPSVVMISVRRIT